MTRPIGDTPRQVRIRIVHDKQLELMQLEMRIAAGLGPQGATEQPAEEPKRPEPRRPGFRRVRVPNGGEAPRRSRLLRPLVRS